MSDTNWFIISDENWNNNELQFARLLHEIDATQFVRLDELAEQMDLDVGGVEELFDRANEVFTGVKLND